MTFRALLYTSVDGIATVTLNRPHVLNAYSVEMRDEFFEVLSAIRDDTEVRVLVLRGSGRAFCAGADLTEFGTAPSPTAARRIRFARDVWTLLHHLRVPSIASLHGFAFGSGLEMALFCDLRIAAQGTLFALPEVRLGMIPAAGGTQTLPRAVGTSYALDLLLTGRRFEAREALQRGLVSWVVPSDQLQSETVMLARRLADLDHRAVLAIRQAVRGGAELPINYGLALEARLAAMLKTTIPDQEATGER